MNLTVKPIHVLLLACFLWDIHILKIMKKPPKLCSEPLRVLLRKDIVHRQKEVRGRGGKALNGPWKNKEGLEDEAVSTVSSWLNLAVVQTELLPTCTEFKTHHKCRTTGDGDLHLLWANLIPLTVAGVAKSAINTLPWLLEAAWPNEHDRG